MLVRLSPIFSSYETSSIILHFLPARTENINNPDRNSKRTFILFNKNWIEHHWKSNLSSSLKLRKAAKVLNWSFLTSGWLNLIKIHSASFLLVCIPPGKECHTIKNKKISQNPNFPKWNQRTQIPNSSKQENSSFFNRKIKINRKNKREREREGN